MTEMALIKWLLFLLIITETEGWKSSNYSLGEKTMKTILESCFGKSRSPSPVVIFGNFNEFIDGVSIIRVNDFLNTQNYKEHESLGFKASSIVLMEELPEKLVSHVKQLRRTKLWDNMVPFFIIGRSTSMCTNSKIILATMWWMEILNSIYICSNSITNTPEIYTLNPITNHAPYPWTRVDQQYDLNVFRQNFNANISCTHLTYDKTATLSGYDIVAVDYASGRGMSWVSGQNYFGTYAKHSGVPSKALRTIILALNASGTIEIETGRESMLKRYHEGSADIMIPLYTIDSFPNNPYSFPLRRTELVAVVKLKAEVSTLEKICHIWSTPVLIGAALALAVLFLILIIMRWSFGYALLDITRFLTYSSIQINNRYQSFRIYFATMLIFIVISNGVFEGNIAAFLTTRERKSAPESIDALITSGYQFYITENLMNWGKKGCPRCEFKEISTRDVCIEFVLNSTKNACVMPKIYYESEYIQLPLDRVRESLISELSSFKWRKNWPLRDRFNGMLIRLVESGLPDFWQKKLTSTQKAKRQSMEAEWASTEYRPVALAKLDFAFQLLAAGLSLATIVFLLELCWARYVNP